MGSFLSGADATLASAGLTSSEIPLTGRERRESERAIAYWEKRFAELGSAPTLRELDLADMDKIDWAHRFLIAVDPTAESSSLLLYGSRFAGLLQLPLKTAPHLPMVRQLPKRFSAVFTNSCRDLAEMREPLRVEGSVEREDGQQEHYRAAFIAIGVRPHALTCMAFGAFNSALQ